MMGPSRTEKSTNVRFSIADAFWATVSDWAVGEIPTPLFGEDAECLDCGEPAVCAERCEQCALEHELFHRETRSRN